MRRTPWSRMVTDGARVVVETPSSSCLLLSTIPYLSLNNGRSAKSPPSQALPYKYLWRWQKEWQPASIDPHENGHHVSNERRSEERGASWLQCNHYWRIPSILFAAQIEVSGVALIPYLSWGLMYLSSVVTIAIVSILERSEWWFRDCLAVGPQNSELLWGLRFRTHGSLVIGHRSSKEIGGDTSDASGEPS